MSNTQLTRNTTTPYKPFILEEAKDIFKYLPKNGFIDLSKYINSINSYEELIECAGRSIRELHFVNWSHLKDWIDANSNIDNIISDDYWDQQTKLYYTEKVELHREGMISKLKKHFLNKLKQYIRTIYVPFKIDCEVVEFDSAKELISYCNVNNIIIGEMYVQSNVDGEGGIERIYFSIYKRKHIDTTIGSQHDIAGVDYAHNFCAWEHYKGKFFLVGKLNNVRM